MATRYERWDVRNSILSRRLKSGREFVVVGTTKPSTDTCGVLPGIGRTNMTSGFTITTPNTVIQNRNILGVLDIRTSGVSVINCTAYGIKCTDINCSNAFIQDCWVRPPETAQSFTYGAGIYGHDFTVSRCIVEKFIDGFNVNNSGLAPGQYQTNVVIEHNIVGPLAYWTDDQVGTVHNQDTWSHNDGCQHFGGFGTIYRGNWGRASFARQYAHWNATNWPGGPEPWTSVALNSLPDGGPWHLLPDRGTGTEATGRYNSDSTSPVKAISLTNFLINHSQGPSRELVVTDNWFDGGDLGFNGGGTNYTGDGILLITIQRNRLDRTQGNQNTSGGNPGGLGGFGNGYTSGSTIITGKGTSNRNYYEDTGNNPSGQVQVGGQDY